MSESVQLVGILNVTPDSFSDGGLFVEADKAFAQAEQLFAGGASIIDIGAEATNPQAEAISSDEEWSRLKPILTQILPLLKDLNFSIDTRNASTVERVVKLVGDRKFYVNDVTTFLSGELRAVTAKHGLSAIISHSPLSAGGDIKKIHATNMDSMDEVRAELLQQQAKLIADGVPSERIILDPGIGFGKTMRLNWQLLQFAKFLPGVPLMIGHSNKRFLATDPTTSEIVENIDRYGEPANQVAAAIAIKTCREYTNPLLLRIHAPRIYQSLLVG